MLKVKARFVDALATKPGLTNLHPISELAIRYEPYQLAESFGAVGALDLITTFWELSREPSLNPFAADRFYVTYVVEARLLRLETSTHGRPQRPAVACLLRSEDSKLLWQRGCFSNGAGQTYMMKSLQQLSQGIIPAQDGQQAILEEWTANNGARLKGQLNEVAETCATALLAEFAESRKFCGQHLWAA